jgi:hypothetical protein
MLKWMWHRPWWQPVLAVTVVLAFVASFGAAGVTLVDRKNALDAQREAISVTCQQVKKVRTDLVKVLEAARDISLKYGRPSQYTDAQEAERQARIRAFYAPQLARVRPVRCP